MAKYELLYLIPGKYTEEEVDPIMAGVRELLAKNQAQDVNEKNLGKKKLAYPIKQNHYGYYVLTDFMMAGENVTPLEKALRLMPEILRSQIVHYLEPIKTQAKTPIARPETGESTISRFTPMADFNPTEPTKETLPGAPMETATQSENREKKSKVSLAELDQKLDEILKEEII